MLRLLQLALVLVALVFVAMPNTARADARTQARRAFRDGMALIAAKSYEAGIERLIDANEALPHPNVQFNIAQAYLALGRDAEAARWFRMYVESGEPPADADAIRALIAKLEAPTEVEAPPPPAPEPTVVPPLSTQEDLRRLEALADAMRPLAEARADELDAITDRMRGALRSPPPAPPPPPPPPPPPVIVAAPPIDEELRAVEDYQEREVVTTATRDVADPRDAPAVVWVITQREIRTRGYETVGEALRAVAGLHVIDDHVFVDVGVRGLHSGPRGMSRIIKVLVDGHPVAFRPTSGTLLGPELIPIRAVDRIELVRGPGSALYGANAFLGVLQIITRRGADVGGGAVTGRIGFSTSTERVDGSARPNTSGSLDAIVGTSQGKLSIVAAAQVAYLDRSGLRIPETSPFVEELTLGRGGVSVDDQSRPLSLFGSLAYDLGSRGKLSFTAGWQRLDADAEWLDYGALTHFTRVKLSNAWARLSYDLQISKETGIRAYASYADGQPVDGHQIRPLSAFALSPNEARHLVESYRSRALVSGLEARWNLADHGIGIRAGTDLDVDFEELTTVTAVFDEDVGINQVGDTITIARSAFDERTFTNVGLYLQVLAEPIESLDVVGGLRYDFNSIYASALNGRLGAVFRATDHFYVKALYGSSYRAPAPDQLYRGAGYIGDAIGCFDYEPCAATGLVPQTAHTGEAVVGYSKDRVRAQLTGYVMFVDDLIVSFPTFANNAVTTNAGEYLSRGLELELSAKRDGLIGALDVATHAYVAVQSTETRIPESQFDPAESIRAEFRDDALFPNVTAGGGIDLAYLPAKLGLYIEARYVGPRRASGSNLALSLGLSNYDGDDLPGYVELDLNLSTRDLYVFEENETVLSLRVTDVIGARHAEGGYRGWDIPTPGRIVFVRLTQEY